MSDVITKGWCDARDLLPENVRYSRRLTVFRDLSQVEPEKPVDVVVIRRDSPERLRRATRAFQAASIAIRFDPALLASALALPPQDFTAFHEGNVSRFNATMLWTDAQAMEPRSLDPKTLGSFAWWARRILDIADAK